MSRYIPVEPEKWGEMVNAMAENARLKAEVEHWQEQWHFVIQDNNNQMDENARLKAEVERLRKAGDAMAEAVGDPTIGDLRLREADWQAAKEGKQS